MSFAKITQLIIFFTRMCQGGNAIFIVLFCSFLMGLELNKFYTDIIMLLQKNASVMLPLTI